MASLRDNIMEAPTVLVLGAGASTPYGFPLGSQLNAGIVNQLASGITKDTLKSLGFNETLMNEFSDILKYGDHPAIDILLEKKPKFRDLGAHLIASAIKPLERHDAIFPQKDWYAHLFEALAFENTDPDAGLLSIVTFNYERSLEYFLDKNIDLHCRDDRVEFAHEKRRKIEVVHAFGSLGEYPSTAYGKTFDENTLKKAATSIKIVSDRLDGSPDFQRAQQLISEANHIVFLGFGYNETTLSKLLEQSTRLDKKHIYGTSYGIDPNIVSRLKKMLGDAIVIKINQRCDQILKTIGMTGKSN